MLHTRLGCPGLEAELSPRSCPQHSEVPKRDGAGRNVTAQRTRRPVPGPAPSEWSRWGVFRLLIAGSGTWLGGLLGVYDEPLRRVPNVGERITRDQRQIAARRLGQDRDIRGLHDLGF